MLVEPYGSNPAGRHWHIAGLLAGAGCSAPFVWLGWQDSNLRMLGSKPSALPLGDTPMKLLGYDNTSETGEIFTPWAT